MRIYIAGKYMVKDGSNHDIPRLCQHNVDKAIEAFHHLTEGGHQPFVPHLSHYVHIHHSSKRDMGPDFWYSYDLTFLELWAEAIYMLKGWQDSHGAVLELERAKELGLKIFYQPFMPLTL